jgi:uncharacterized protein YerC
MSDERSRGTAGKRNALNARRSKVAPFLAAGRSVRAIAAETGIPVGSVHRAKRHLEKDVAQGRQNAAAIAQQLPTSYVVKQEVNGAACQ